MSAVFVADDGQRRAAEASKARLEKELGRSVKTPILPLGVFTNAEDYHQKYYLRNSALMKDFKSFDAAAFRESTAAMRVNGFVAGDGSREDLKTWIDKFGLSEQSKAQLLR
jgi:hypothetical protein